MCALRNGRAANAPAPPAAKQALTGENGTKIGTVTRNSKAVALTVTDTDFGDWLAENMTEVHRTFLETKGGNGRT